MAELTDTIAVVLAAGRGTRMGTPKALMLVDDEPWWIKQSNRLESVGVGSCWVVSVEVEAAMASDERAPTRRVTASCDDPMFASVVAGVMALVMNPPRGVFILPIDTPAPSPCVWADCAATDAVAAPAFNDQNGHPLYLPWVWVKQHLLDTSVDPTTSRLDLMISGSLKHIASDDPDTVTNLNNPDDLNNWLQRNRSNT